jgi:tetratricopeptide (TPR) repeat protein
VIKNTLVLLFVIFGTGAFAQYDKYYYFNKGRDNLINSRHSLAIMDFNTLIQADTMLYDGYFFRGIAKYNLNDYIGALQDFNKALRINPVYTQAYHYRAITLSQLNRFEDAAKDYSAALKLRPDNTGVFFSRGITHLMSQKFDEAIEDFNSYLKKESHSGEAYVNRGTAYLMKHDTLKALDDYNRALYYNAFDPNAFIRRARIHAMRNENQKALKDLDKAIVLDSTSSLVFFSRALVRYQMEDIEGALRDLSKVIELDPDNALSYYNRALIRSQIGDYNNALDDYGHVMMINPENVLAYYNRAAVEIELKDYYAAIDDYGKAIALYPDFASAYMNRSYAKNQTGQYESARKDHEIARGKIAQFRKETSDSAFSIFADTSKAFNRLLALDADFAKKTFSNKLENRRVAMLLLPQFRFVEGAPKSPLALDKQYFFPPLKEFLKREETAELALSNSTAEMDDRAAARLDSIADALVSTGDGAEKARGYFLKGILRSQLKQYSGAMDFYDRAIKLDPDNMFFRLNRSVGQSEMTEFISNIESSMPKLNIDNSTVSVSNTIINQTYDYSDALYDLEKMERLDGGFAHLHYNRGNLLCLSNKMLEAIESYTRAIRQYPYFAEAYFNRGLISIYLRDTEKGCIDVSKSGEMGVAGAYAIIKKYCLNEDDE